MSPLDSSQFGCFSEGRAPGTVGAAMEKIDRRLARAGIGGPRMEARLLIGEVLGAGPAHVLAHLESELSPDQGARLDAMAERRAGREPLARILGRREFWSLSFTVTADTLIPRPDSETVVEAALDWAKGLAQPPSILDLGTGGGCLLLALLDQLPAARGLGLDIDPSALNVARANARRLGIEDRARFVAGDWGAAIGRSFELVVVNPPYIADKDFPDLAPEVAAYEPRLALAGGADGMDCYRRLAPQFASLVSPGGALFVEIGAGQASAVSGMLSANNLQVFDIKRDLAGIPRCLAASPAVR